MNGFHCSAKISRMKTSLLEVERLQITDIFRPEIENMKNESEEVESNSCGSTDNCTSCLTFGNQLHDSNSSVTTESYGTSESETDSGCIVESVGFQTECEEDLRASVNFNYPKYSVLPSAATDMYTAFINLR